MSAFSSLMWGERARLIFSSIINSSAGSDSALSSPADFSISGSLSPRLFMDSDASSALTLSIIMPVISKNACLMKLLKSVESKTESAGSGAGGGCGGSCAGRAGSSNSGS